MSSISNSAIEPNYLTRLALSSVPFNNSISTASFFHGEQIEQRLNLLLHLLRASDKIPCVVAPQGGGKSTLLSELKQSAGDELRICHIEASPTLTTETLVEQCLRDFGVDDAERVQTNDLHNLLKTRLDRLTKLSIRPVLLLDNFDLLNAETQSVINQWLSWQVEENFLLQAVLTANSVMAAWSQLAGRSQRVDLPNLSEQELPQYLMHRLTAAGYSGELPFTDKELKYFYRQSNGLPAKVNQLAHQKLLGLSTAKSTINFDLSKSFVLLKWLALGLLVISLIVLLMFQQQINALFDVQGNENTEQVEILPFNEADDELATVIVEEDKVTSSEQAGRDELASLVATLADENSKPSLVTEPIQSEAELKQEVKATESVVQPVARSAIHKEEWIQKQQSSDYTFQLMGSWEHVEVQEFIDKYALTGDVAEFESMRNGRVWYALIYGVYSDKKTALQASKSWPAPLNTLPSWLRRFDSVQKQIKDKAQAQ